MNRYQILLTAILIGILWMMVASITLFFEPALAAPLSKPEESRSPQVSNAIQFVSVSAMAFQPIQSNLPYIKDPQRQLLGLSQGIGPGRYLFVAPLILPDRSEWVGLTVFGEDFDNQGE